MTLIDIESAIERRRDEIARLQALRDELLALVMDAQAVAWGEGGMSSGEFTRRVTAAEREAANLSLRLPTMGALDTWEVR